MARVTITDRLALHAKANGALQVDYFDTKEPGLSLRVSPGGRKSWTFLHTRPSDGKRARITFGTYPAMSLAGARGKAVEARGFVEAGQDPRAAMGASLAGAMTMKGLVESYIAKHAKPNLRSYREIERRLVRNVVSAIGDVRLAELHKRDVNRVIDPILRRESPIEAARVFEDLRAICRWAVARGDMDSNPMDGMRKPADSKPRKRVLNDVEIRKIWRELPISLAKSPICQRILKLCLVTCARVGEVAGMTKDELDLRGEMQWRIPGDRTKNGFDHVVPLTALALEVIAEAIEWAGRSNFVFPAPASRGLASFSPHAVARTLGRAHVASEARPLGRFGIPHWTAHDLRRTGLDYMARLAIPRHIRAWIANHVSVTKAGVTDEHYTIYEFLPERRAALNLWADRLSSIIADEKAAIVLSIGE
jgi:integrase